MRITKKGDKYIRDFSKFAVMIFAEQGWTWGGPPLEESGHTPDVLEIYEKATSRVLALNKQCSMSLSGRIVAHESDFDLGFRLMIEYPLFQSQENQKEKT
jgi:hypothetical protein